MSLNLRYDSQSIRPMPRFVERAQDLLEQITVVRDHISQLNEQLKEVSSLVIDA